jgi:hypothetical protein
MSSVFNNWRLAVQELAALIYGNKRKRGDTSELISFDWSFEIPE